MVSGAKHGIRAISAMHYAIKKWCLAMLKIAGPCQTRSQKTLYLFGLMRVLMPLGASRCRISNHSHSIVPGGLEVMS
jgi:hypothetical protein